MTRASSRWLLVGLIVTAVACQRAPIELTLLAEPDAGTLPECSADVLARFVEKAPIVPLDDRRAARSMLLEMLQMDQCQRQLGHHGMSVDPHNAEQLARLIDRYGWPSRRTWGEESDRAALLIVQHAKDVTFEARVLAMLEQLVKTGDTSPVHVAYLHDRVFAVRRKLPQRYGTQGWCVAVGSWKPLPIEDEAGVDHRREEVGLEPLAAYVEKMSEVCTEASPPPM
jgi:hypothetical protein